MDQIANGKLREYQEIIQWGAKSRTIALSPYPKWDLHVLERLRPILNLKDIEDPSAFQCFQCP